MSIGLVLPPLFVIFFFNDTATTEIYTLSLHDALPICIMPQTEEHLAILELLGVRRGIPVLTKRDLVDAEWLGLVRTEVAERLARSRMRWRAPIAVSADRKSTRLNSSHSQISYAVFCLK